MVRVHVRVLDGYLRDCSDLERFHGETLVNFWPIIPVKLVSPKLISLNLIYFVLRDEARYFVWSFFFCLACLRKVLLMKLLVSVCSTPTVRADSLLRWLSWLCWGLHLFVSIIVVPYIGVCSACLATIAMVFIVGHGNQAPPIQVRRRADCIMVGNVDAFIYWDSSRVGYKDNCSHWLTRCSLTYAIWVVVDLDFFVNLA